VLASRGHLKIIVGSLWQFYLLSEYDHWNLVSRLLVSFKWPLILRGFVKTINRHSNEFFSPSCTCLCIWKEMISQQNINNHRIVIGFPCLIIPGQCLSKIPSCFTSTCHDVDGVLWHHLITGSKFKSFLRKVTLKMFTFHYPLGRR